MNPPCVVLAGGLGTRLRSVLPNLPKCLAPVQGRPFLEWQLRSLARKGIDRFVLALGHGAAQVQESVAQWSGPLQIDCVVEPQPLGTGGAVQFAMISRGLNEALVINGDTYVGGDLSGMLSPLDRKDGEIVRMAVVDVPNRNRFGGVVMSPDGRVTCFIEKGEMGAGAINAGLYRVDIEAFCVADRSAFSFETLLLPRLAKSGQLRAEVVSGPFIDIGVPEDYQLYCERHGDFDDSSK